MTSLKVTVFLLLLICCGATNAQQVLLNRQTKAQLVENISVSLKENYIYLDTALKMSDYIRRQLKTAAYDTIATPSVFASRLTADLLSVYHDGHLSISYNPAFAGGNEKPNPATEKQQVERRLKFRKRVNFGFDKAEILPGNIGYLKIGGFFAPDSAAKEMTKAALRFVSNSEALIIDLRENMGGDPDMVSYICGFLFKTKTHINNLYSRKEKSMTTYWAIPDSSVKGLNSIPVCILTSHKTFSAGEELAYDLQTQKRATIIGETTGGGAHPVAPIPVENGFVANIPFARAINPVTGTNWEGIGVKPDITVSADKALDTALARLKNN